MKALIFDLETGGLDYKKFSPLSIAACVSDISTGEILDQFDTLIKLPEYTVEEQAMAVNKLSVEECRINGMEPDKIGERLLDMWTNHGCSVIGGHNIHFDIRYASHWIFNIEPYKFEQIFTYRYLDTFPLIQLLLGTKDGPPGTSLKQCIKYFKIDMKEVEGGFHTAMFDVIATTKLLIKFRQLLETSSSK